MTNLIAAGSGGLTGTNVSFGSGSTGLRDLLAQNQPAAQTTGNGASSKTSMLAAKFARANRAAPTVKQNAEQVKASAAAYAEKCWTSFAQAYPEAFRTRAGLSVKAPKLVFVPTQTEFDKVLGTSTDSADMVAFVKSDDPSRVYVHTPNLVKYVNQFGPGYVKSTISHELIHCLTNQVIARMNNDMDGKSTSYAGVQEDLRLNFSFDTTKSPGIRGLVSIRELIAEFAAEHFANKATGVASSSVAYAPVRATGKKLLQLVGENVFRKAVFENDSVAYRRVVAAAKTLQGQNVKARALEEKTDFVTSMRAAQAATPSGSPLSAAMLEKLKFRYARETVLGSHLASEFPNEIKNFDFRFMNAIDADLKKRGVTETPDSGDAFDRELAVSIQRVWSSFK
jgi:hypothetical protein